MVIRRRRHGAPATPDRAASSNATRVRPTLRNELLARIAAGARSFELRDRDSAPSVEAFQHTVRAVESLASAGLITIGVRETATAEPGQIVVIRRIRLTEAGKRRAAAARAPRQPG